MLVSNGGIGCFVKLAPVDAGDGVGATGGLALLYDACEHSVNLLPILVPEMPLRDWRGAVGDVGIGLAIKDCGTEGQQLS